MRRFIDIDLSSRSVTTRQLEGREIAECGRYLITRMLLDEDVADKDPLGPENPLIFSAGPFAGTNFSNANRLSVGCKSPLTGGVKEANSGGTFAFAMGQLEISGLTFRSESDDWVVIHIPLEGEIRFHSAGDYMGLGVFDTAAKLHTAFGDKVSLAICGPVGEYQGLLAGISFSDIDNRPWGLVGGGGGGVGGGGEKNKDGAKKIKAVVIDKHKMPTMKDRKKVMQAVKMYGKLLGESPAVQALEKLGTAMVSDLTNTLGALPTDNFSSGQSTPQGSGPHKMGGDFIRELNLSRGGEPSHACMPGCLIKCSNVYMNADGIEVVSPLEYETIGLLGTNCGLRDPDQVALLNEIANDLGVDTIELGGMIGVLMEAGQAAFGDVDFMVKVLQDLRAGNERGRLLATGTARVGAHFDVKRVPVIKKQAISAYDPRIIEVTAISMMVTAQGADHTAGNAPSFVSHNKSVREVAAESYRMQVNSALADSFGLCVFGRSVTDVNRQLIADAINDAFDAGIDAQWLIDIARETLRLETEFNKRAGFTEAEDELPSFFADEPLPPTNRTARMFAREVNVYMKEFSADKTLVIT
jgi:aldehyde:ferredoxin oxidoreductase